MTTHYTQNVMQSAPYRSCTPADLHRLLKPLTFHPDRQVHREAIDLVGLLRGAGRLHEQRSRAAYVQFETEVRLARRRMSPEQSRLFRDAHRAARDLAMAIVFEGGRVPPARTM